MPGLWQVAGESVADLAVWLVLVLLLAPVPVLVVVGEGKVPGRGDVYYTYTLLKPKK